MIKMTELAVLTDTPMPKTPHIDKPAARESHSRILTYNSETKEVIWEKKKILPTDPTPMDQ